MNVSSEYCLFWLHQNKDIMMLMELFYKTIIHTWNILKLQGNILIVHIETKKDRDHWHLKGLSLSSTR